GVASAEAAEEPSRRQSFRIRLPGPARLLDRVGETPRRDRAVDAVRRVPEGRAADHGEVVREAGMPDTVELRRFRIDARVKVERRRITAAEDAAGLLVLEDDDDHMVEIRDRRDGARGRA